VVSAKVGRANACPLRIVPAFGQAAKYFSHCESGGISPLSVDEFAPSRAQPWCVLHEDDSRSYQANDFEKFWPEPAFVRLRFPPSGEADGLARESSANKINWLNVRYLLNIAVPAQAWPVLRENTLAVHIFFDLPSARHAGSL
jgi:hypothetical protein